MSDDRKLFKAAREVEPKKQEEQSPVLLRNEQVAVKNNMTPRENNQIKPKGTYIETVSFKAKPGTVDFLEGIRNITKLKRQEIHELALLAFVEKYRMIPEIARYHEIMNSDNDDVRSQFYPPKP